MHAKHTRVPVSTALSLGVAGVFAISGGCSSTNNAADATRTTQPAEAMSVSSTAPATYAAESPNTTAANGMAWRQQTMAVANDRPGFAPVDFGANSAHGPLSPLAGLTERDLGDSAEAADTSENLFQATFGREGADFDPEISRDGKFLVFASTQHRATSDLYVKSINGQTVTQLTNDASNDVMPSFSPDGQRIAFASNRSGSWDIYVIGAGGGQPIQITSEPSHELHPTWSPDGRSLAFCRLNPGSGRWEIWALDVTNPGSTKFLAHGLLPEWNPTSDIIAFQKPRERGERFYSVWTIRFENGEATSPTEIAGDPVFACVSPTWSPDGSRLAFAAVANPGGPVVGGLGFKPTESQLWMINLDGTGRSRLTEGSFVNVMPRWGGDGRLYFVSNRAGVENIWGLTPQRAIQTASFDGQGASPTQHPTHPEGHGSATAHAPAATPGAAHATPNAAPMTHNDGAHAEKAQGETASAPAGHDEPEHE